MYTCIDLGTFKINHFSDIKVAEFERRFNGDWWYIENKKGRPSVHYTHNGKIYIKNILGDSSTPKNLRQLEVSCHFENSSLMFSTNMLDIEIQFYVLSRDLPDYVLSLLMKYNLTGEVFYPKDIKKKIRLHKHNLKKEQ